MFTANGAFIATNQPLLAWQCDQPSVTNFAVIMDGGAPIAAGVAPQYQVPAPLAESLHAWSVIADATSGSAASPTNTFIADANLATNGFGLFYAQNPGDAVIVDPFAGLAGNYAWYLAGIPQTYSNTHLKLTIRDKAGSATLITSPLFNVIDQGDLRTSAWRYVTMYPQFEFLPNAAGHHEHDSAAVRRATGQRRAILAGRNRDLHLGRSPAGTGRAGGTDGRHCLPLRTPTHRRITRGVYRAIQPAGAVALAAPVSCHHWMCMQRRYCTAAGFMLYYVIKPFIT